jgi:hypothetical protein
MAGVLVAIGSLMPLINDLFGGEFFVMLDRLKQWLWYNEFLRRLKLGI